MKKTLSILLLLLIIIYSGSGQDGRMIFKGVPIVNITLLDGKTEGDINKETKFNATMSISNANSSNFPTSQLFSGNITIKGRGNATWTLPKRPYNIVTTDSTFKKKAVPVFGMPSGSAWTLLADYEDRTYLKTLFTSALSYTLGLPWASRGLRVELYINGEYRGLYVFCEKVERDINRVNIAELKTTDNSGNAITGGYTLEQQILAYIGSDEVSFADDLGKYWSYKIPDSDKLTVQQNDYIKNYWNSFLYKIFNEPLSDTLNGYRSVINPTSFAQYFLLEDICKNSDAYVTSWYVTKDKLRKMDAGPGWDWGITWGARNMFNGVNYSNAQDTYVPTICSYYAKMMQDTFFSNLVKFQFDQSKGKINQLLSDVESYYPKLVATGAVSRDANRWPNIFSDSDWNYFPTHQKYVEAFLSFAKRRIYYQEHNLYNLQAAKPVHADLP